MKCPKCAAANEEGALACDYCGATLAAGDSLGEGARALEGRFDALAAAVAKELAGAVVPEVGTPQSMPAALAKVGENAARMRGVLDATARAIPRPHTPQEALVWLRRAPALVWVSYRALGHTRNFQLEFLYEVLAELYAKRAAWEARDRALPGAFAQAEHAMKLATPSVGMRLKRFARTNPVIAAVVVLATVWGLWSAVAGALGPSPSRSRPRRSRPRRHAVVLVLPAPDRGRT